GGLITENYPVGPLGGVAFNATLLSYNGSLDIGIHIDSAAVEQPELLREEVERSLNKLIYAVAQPASPAQTGNSRANWREVLSRPKWSALTSRLKWWSRPSR
ncbi:MAG: WS/DGAT domain-containing protein, partial [Actinomycetota bacterium]